MGTIKITTLLAALVLVGLIVTVFGLFAAELSTDYNVTENGSSLSRYSQMDDLTAMSEDVRDKEADLGGDTSALDLLGLMFTNGYKALKATKDSIDLFSNIAEDSTDDINLGAASDVFKTALIVIIIIFVIIGVFVAAIVKRDL